MVVCVMFGLAACGGSQDRAGTSGRPDATSAFRAAIKARFGTQSIYAPAAIFLFRCFRTGSAVGCRNALGDELRYSPLSH